MDDLSNLDILNEVEIFETGTRLFILSLKSPIDASVVLSDEISHFQSEHENDPDNCAPVKETEKWGCTHYEFPDESEVYTRDLKNSGYPDFFHSSQIETLKEIYNESKEVKND